MAKPPSVQQARITGDRAPGKPELRDSDVQKLVEELADKPYAGPGTETSEPVRKAKPRAITISLPDVMVEQIEDEVLENKRNSGKLRTVSAVIREALVKAGYKAEW